MFRRLAGLRFVSRTLIRPKRVEDELNKELQYHLEREIHRGLRAGFKALRTVPGVDAAAASVVAPGVPLSYQQEFKLLERSPNTDGRIVAGGNVVSPSYFETMQMPLVAGEFCSRQSALSGTMPEVMVNRSFADRYMPGSSPVGLHLADAFTSNRLVGIVADARERGIDRSPEPTVYFCGYPPQPFRVYLVCTANDPKRSAQAVS